MFSGLLRTTAGVLIGLVASAALLSVLDGRQGGKGRTVPRGRLLSDCDGAIDELVIHYVSEAAEAVAETYRDFIPQLPPDVVVYVVCPDRSARDDLLARLGPVQCKLVPVVVDHPVTCWSRDRWLALAPDGAQQGALLLSPRGESGADIWPAREGDQRVADDLAAVLGPRVTSARSELFFDGGDFVADRQTVFVTPDVAARNFQRTVRSWQELLTRLQEIAGREVVLLDEAPDHHAGMYMMALGNRRVLIGDPAAAERLLAGWSDEQLAALCPPQGPDFSEATIARFDAVARQCEEVGYHVQRIPMVPGRDGRTYLSYVNVILDQRQERRVVYLPVFDGAEPLNHYAEQVWTRLGYQVRTIDCTGCYPHYGSLRCLVNVASRLGEN